MDTLEAIAQGLADHLRSKLEECRIDRRDINHSGLSIRVVTVTLHNQVVTVAALSKFVLVSSPQDDRPPVTISYESPDMLDAITNQVNEIQSYVSEQYEAYLLDKGQSRC